MDSAFEPTTSEYEPPTITRVGHLADLTLMPLPPNKTTGAADGATFMGLDAGSI